MVRTRRPRGEPGQLERVTDATSLSAFLDDAAHVPGGSATALVLPRSERAVAEALSNASRVLVVGAQSSLTGGATPRGDVVVSTSRLVSFAEQGATRVRAGAGLALGVLADRLRGRGACYPPAPTFLGATVGGTIATNAAGAATFKYGSTRSWVDGLTVVLASGEVLELTRGGCMAHADGYFDIETADGRLRVPVPHYTMPDVTKLSAGYFAAPRMDLIDLFIGSEGTLGIVTEAALRVLPEAPANCLAFTTFRSRARALDFVAALRERSMRAWRAVDGSGLDISAIEHMDARSLALLREDGVDRRCGVSLDPQATMALLTTIELPTGTTPGEVYAALGDDNTLPTPGNASERLRAFAELLDSFEAADDTVLAPAGDGPAVERLLALREAVPIAVNARVGLARREVDARIEKTAADVVVPFEHFGAMLEVYEVELSRRGLDGAIWGHISDGNVHPNVIPRSFADVVSGREAVRFFGREAVRLGGAPLAEHGVGRSTVKQAMLRDLYGDDGIEEMRAVKRILDPEWKLAPGVLFPSE